MPIYRNAIAVVLALGIGFAPATSVMAADAPAAVAAPASSNLSISANAVSGLEQPQTVVTPGPDVLPSFASMASSSAAAQRGRYGRGRYGRGGGRSTAAGALILGTGAVITGAALLTYANRPDCHADQRASGCGYGTKVVGASVLTGGVVGVAVGAALWR